MLRRPYDLGLPPVRRCAVRTADWPAVPGSAWCCRGAVTQVPRESSHRTRSIAAMTAGSSGSSIPRPAGLGVLRHPYQSIRLHPAGCLRHRRRPHRRPRRHMARWPLRRYLRGHQAVNDNPGSPPPGSPLEAGLSGGSPFGRRQAQAARIQNSEGRWGVPIRNSRQYSPKPWSGARAFLAVGPRRAAPRSFSARSTSFIPGQSISARSRTRMRLGMLERRRVRRIVRRSSLSWPSHLSTAHRQAGSPRRGLGSP